MAIKYTASNVIPGLPDNLLSLQGSWSSAPEQGGFITFSGSMVIVETPTASSRSIVRPTYNIPTIGTVYITSESSDKYLGHTKKTYSFSDKLSILLNNKSITRYSSPLVACTRASTVPALVSEICSKLGISFTIPRANKTAIEEPIWAKDGQTLMGVLNEILVANGCILYCLNDVFVCKTISDFFKGLSGESNSNTISSNFTIGGKYTSKIGSIEINGTQAKKVDLTVPASSSSGGGGGQNQATKTYVYGTRKITSIDSDGKNRKTVVIEDYEPEPASQQPPGQSSGGAGGGASKGVQECYPYDPARITRRETQVYHLKDFYENEFFLPCRKEFYNSCNVAEDQIPTQFSGFPSEIMVEKVIETWIYNTAVPKIYSNPATYIEVDETVKYTKITERKLGIDNMSECSVTYGISFDFLDNPDDASDFSKAVQSKLDLAQGMMPHGMITVEEERISWKKEKGSYKWYGTHEIFQCAARREFDLRRTKIEEYKKKIERGDDGYTFGSYADWKNNMINNFVFLTNSADYLSMGRTYVTTKEDWQPSYSTFPAKHRIHNIPWSKELSAGGGSRGGSGSVVFEEKMVLNAGRFSDPSTMETIAKEIRDARYQRDTSLAVTNINELFKVGMIDAPSFSVSVDGIKSSGVYLNG